MTVTNGAGYPGKPGGGMSIDGMTPAHAKPERRDRIWVLAIVAVCCLIKVWPSWVGIGAAAGFPVIGGKHGMPTDWTLAVIVEAYWAYAVYAWLAAPAGRRSTRFAMGTAAGVFVLSLVGQGAEGWMSAPFVTALANDMPVLILALIAVLVHLRHLDRAEAAAAEQAQRQAEREAQKAAAEEDELAVLRAQIAAQAEELSAAQSGLAAAQQQAAEATAKTEAAARKLAATAASKRGRKAPQKKPAAAPATRVPRDVNVQAQALSEVAAKPGITGKELGPLVGRSERWGQEFLKNLAAAPKGPEE